jgi:diguanylate cyclase (GGDEF)-like protein
MNGSTSTSSIAIGRGQGVGELGHARELTAAGFRDLRPERRTKVLCAMGVASLTILAIVLVSCLAGISPTARELSSRALPAEVALRRATAATASAQDTFLASLQAGDAQSRALLLTASSVAGKKRDDSWAAYLKVALDRPGERALQKAYEAAAASSVPAAAALLGLSPTDTTNPATLAEERKQFDAEINALTALQTKIYHPIVASGAATIVTGIDRARIVMLGSIAAFLLIFAAVGLWLMRDARREARHLSADAATLKAAAREADLETSLQRALEMVAGEELTYDVIAQAITIAAPGVPAEMLLADSSHAHFRQVLSTSAGNDTACGVLAPRDCPATITGQQRIFDDSSSLDTCPYLRGRDEAVWAKCVPVSIAGRATGVIHTQGPLARPRPEILRGLVLVARKAGERIGMLRAFDRSETQAQTDPLTGLLNRRSLEARVHELGQTELPFVVAYGDLDHFKLLNDVHGHDAGDRALRLFSRVMRDSLRPDDIPARYGGEEFVAVLPDCTLDNATVVIERIRARLREVLAAGTVPAFTASFGLAANEPGLTFSETVEAADTALLLAKRTGRDRIVLSGTETIDDRTPGIPQESGAPSIPEPLTESSFEPTHP